MRATDAPKSAGEMMTDVLGSVSNLVRSETDLARAEIGESLTKAGSSIGTMALALALGIAGLNMLAVALVPLLVSFGLPPHWAAAVIGAALLLAALVIYSSAKSALNQIGFVPTRAARNVQRDVAAVKDSFNEK